MGSLKVSVHQLAKRSGCLCTESWGPASGSRHCSLRRAEGTALAWRRLGVHNLKTTIHSDRSSRFIIVIIFQISITLEIIFAALFAPIPYSLLTANFIFYFKFHLKSIAIIITIYNWHTLGTPQYLHKSRLIISAYSVQDAF